MNEFKKKKIKETAFQTKVVSLWINYALIITECLLNDNELDISLNCLLKIFVKRVCIKKKKRIVKYICNI